MTYETMILKILSDGKMRTTTMIEKHCRVLMNDCKPGAVSGTLSRLAAKGKICRRRYGMYQGII